MTVVNMLDDSSFFSFCSFGFVKVENFFFFGRPHCLNEMAFGINSFWFNFFFCLLFQFILNDQNIKRRAEEHCVDILKLRLPDISISFIILKWNNKFLSLKWKQAHPAASKKVCTWNDLNLTKLEFNDLKCVVVVADVLKNDDDDDDGVEEDEFFNR